MKSCLVYALEQQLKLYQDKARKAHVISDHEKQRVFYEGVIFGLQEALAQTQTAEAKRST